MKENTINIIIPVYNEEVFISEVVNNIIKYFTKAKTNNKYRIVIINDGSTDKTSVEINKISQKHKSQDIITLNNLTNSGKGFSIRKAFNYCKDGIIIIQDADLEYSPTEYHKLLNPIIDNKTDVVYGSRFQGSEPKRVLYYTHFIANKTLTTLSNIFTGLNLSDIETCYKAFRTDLLKEIILKENRFGFEFEITAKLSRVKNVRFVEVGISYFGRTYAEGKKIKFKDALRTLYCVFKYNIWSRK